MIFSILRTGWISLRRDRFALALSFALPVIFFSIFAAIFGGHRDSSMARIHVIVVDQDRSRASRRLVSSLAREGALVIETRPPAGGKNSSPPPDYTAATAEAAVKAGNAPIALIVPQGFGAHPISFDPRSSAAQSVAPIQLLNDASDPISPQMVAGLLQKAVMTAMPVEMARQGMEVTGRNIGGFTPEQLKRMQQNLEFIRQHEDTPSAVDSSTPANTPAAGAFIAVQSRAVAGEDKKNPMVSYYASAIGVMFLLFTASGAAGSLLDEAESGALDRVLCSRVDMNLLLTGKLVFSTVLALSQLTVMFVWAWLLYGVDLPHHIPGFLVMGVSTAFSVAAFGILLASICRTRAQLGAISTLAILIMSSIGGSMVPRMFMPEAMQKAGFFTINGWAIDGFTKVFWRDLPVTQIWLPVSVLLAIGVALFLIARRIARRWEYA